MNFTGEKGGIRLAKRVERWQQRLSALGVAHWEIKSVSMVDLEDAQACVYTSDQYDSCRFYFDHDFLASCDARQLDHAICHEWMHVAMRDLDRFIEQFEHWMPVATYQDFEANLKRLRERHVDNVARALHAAHTDTPVRAAPTAT